MTDIPLPEPGDTSWSDWGGEQEDLSDAAREIVSGRLTDAAVKAAAVEAVKAAATKSATADSLVKRDAFAAVDFAIVGITDPPTNASHGTRKDYVDTKAARRLTQKAVTAAYTLAAADAVDTVLHVTAGTAITITLPDDTVAIDTEVAIPWRQYDAGQITFAAGTGAALLSRGGAVKSAGQYAEGVVTKVAASTWLLSGDVV